MVGSRVYGNRYEVQREIAHGGMADVYLARDLTLDRVVAIKVLSAELSRDPSFVERFRLEAQAAGNLNHPNVVAVYDWGQEASTSYIVMEYVEGHTLRDLIHSQHRVPPAQTADIGAEIAAALAFAHQAGVVHRDVKPGNVLITPAGQVKVTDFGIARADGAAGGLTRTGAVMGTATYFSPEQAQGLPVDGRSDVYSLGVVLYEMATGRPPFTGENPVTVAYQHVREPVPPLDPAAAVPPDLERIILTCLAKDPLERYQSADDLRADLLRLRRGQPVVGGPVTAAVASVDPTRAVAAAAPPPAGPPPAGTTGGRGRGWAIALVVALGLVVAAVVGWLIFGLFQGDDGKATVTVRSVIDLPFAEARSRLEAQGLEVKVVRRVDDRPVGTVIGQDPGAGEKVDRGSTVKLTVSAGQGTKEVPAVAGQSVEEAQRILTELGFTTTTKEEASENVSAGTVIGTLPAAGKRADVGSQVTIVVSTGQPAVTMPNVVGQDQVAATQTLVGAGLSVQKRTTASSTVPSGDVVSTDPTAGATAHRGDQVTIVVSSGPQQVTVPNVVGQAQSSATATLQGAGFTVDVQSVPSSPTNAGKVIAQSPQGGSSAAHGTAVTITVGSSTSTSTSSTTGGGGSP